MDELSLGLDEAGARFCCSVVGCVSAGAGVSSGEAITTGGPNVNAGVVLGVSAASMTGAN